MPTNSGPQITLWLNNLEEATLRRVKQLGVDHVCMGGPKIPWTTEKLGGWIETLGAAGLELRLLMIGGFDDAIYGREGRDEQIEQVCASIRAAGQVELPVIEYNFYAHRITEGYFEVEGRGGAGLLAFDYERVRNLPPLEGVGAHPLEQMWENVTYFLKAVVPVAESAGVRLALHPNDPPPPISWGSGQIMGSLEGWKRLVDIVPSPHNGITFDPGVTREIGEDPVEVCRWFCERDCVNHAHYRNVEMRVAREQYTEVFLDEGEVDMFAVMRELVRQRYSGLVYPEHPPQLDADRENSFPGAGGAYSGFAYTIGYARAMLQAATAVEGPA